MTAPAELIQSFRFVVHLTVSPRTSGPEFLGDGMFAECSGLELEADIREYAEGGRNDGVVRRVGRAKLSPIVLKRGMFVAGDTFADTALWDWITGMTTGSLPLPRYDGDVRVLSPNGLATLARWVFDRGLPSKVTGPSLNARTGEIAIEELHIHHEGLRLLRPESGAPEGRQP
jgi:phage tail-like protein